MALGRFHNVARLHRINKSLDRLKSPKAYSCYELYACVQKIGSV